jgi:hypothetical protein
VTVISRAPICSARARHSAKAAERLCLVTMALLIELVVHLGMN